MSLRETEGYLNATLDKQSSNNLMTDSRDSLQKPT